MPNIGQTLAERPTEMRLSVLPGAQIQGCQLPSAMV
jgi:hypothetical protein